MKLALIALAIASWYSEPQMTASGEKFNPKALTCAHRTLPFNTMIKVSRDGRSVTCRVNDRGPFVRGRDIDLSEAAADVLKIKEVGIARVELTPTHVGEHFSIPCSDCPKSFKSVVENKNRVATKKNSSTSYKNKRKNIVRKSVEHLLRHPLSYLQ